MFTPETAASPNAASASTTAAPVRRASGSAALGLGSTMYFRRSSGCAAAFRAWIWPIRPAPNSARLNIELPDSDRVRRSNKDYSRMVAGTDTALDLIAVGRSSVDLYGEQLGGRLEDMGSFAKYLGGSPANTAVAAARLGLKSGLFRRVRADQLGG